MVNPEHPLWYFLCDYHSDNASWNEWLNLFTSSSCFAQFAEKYLVLSEKTADWVLCRTECWRECSRMVIEHSNDDIRAVCQHNKERGYKIRREETLLYDFNRENFHRALCAASGITFRENSLEEMNTFFQIGYIPRYQQEPLPVYLIYEFDSINTNSLFSIIHFMNAQKFLLLLPTRKMVSTEMESFFRRSESHLLILSEELTITPSGNLVAHMQFSERIFQENNSSGKKQRSSLTHFDIPSGLSWEDVTMYFVDGHRISIRAGIKTGVYDYNKMGMSSRRNSNPTKQWELLQTFAESNGTIDWKTAEASFRLKKQKQELNETLKSFFKQERDPIEWNKESNAYTCRFRIFPEDYR